MRLLEAWGLWRARAWASWLGCIGSAAYLPLEVDALYRHPGWPTAALLVVQGVAESLRCWVRATGPAVSADLTGGTPAAPADADGSVIT